MRRGNVSDNMRVAFVIVAPRALNDSDERAVREKYGARARVQLWVALRIAYGSRDLEAPRYAVLLSRRGQEAASIDRFLRDQGYRAWVARLAEGTPPEYSVWLPGASLEFLS